MQIANIKQFTREHKSLIITQNLFRYIASLSVQMSAFDKKEIEGEDVNTTRHRVAITRRGQAIITILPDYCHVRLDGLLAFVFAPEPL